MTDQQPDLKAIKADFVAFIQGVPSCALATTNPEGLPEASYAPCIYHQSNFYIFVSELASHTRNLLDHPQASLLLTESQPRNLFACKRATLEITAQPIERDTPLWLAVLSEMETPGQHRKCHPGIKRLSPAGTTTPKSHLRDRLW